MPKGTTDKRRLIKFSNYSMCVTLPKWVIDQLEWQKGDVLTLVTDVKQGKITLSKDKEASQAQPAKTIAVEEVIIPATELPAESETPKLRW